MMAIEKACSETSLPKALRELVKLRASQINGCAYCVDMHTQDMLKEGMDIRKISTVSVWKEVALFDEREKAALLWTETLTKVADNHAPEEIYNQVATQFSETEMAELTLVIGVINAWNRFGVGFGLTVK